MYESMEVLRHLEPAVTDENLLVSRVTLNRYLILYLN